jgi:rfaE bifunctional protein kinase chain/domain
MRCGEILERVRALRALVVGDICLDRWCTYDPALSEPSRETGLERMAVVRTETTPGAGGTVACNLAALGLRRVAVLGAVGDDGHGYELKQALLRSGVDSLLVSSKEPTFTYTKLINLRTGAEDRGRVDFVAHPPDTVTELAMLHALRGAASQFDCVLVSDQAETSPGGVVTDAVRDALRALAQSRRDLVVWVDSRMRAELFRNVLVKVNEREAREACQRAGLKDAKALRNRIGHPLLMVTHGPEGVLVLNTHSETWVRAKRVDHPVDICGAGDSFSAGTAAALAAAAPPESAARFGNLVASVTIMKKGTGTASPKELLDADKEFAG